MQVTITTMMPTRTGFVWYAAECEQPTIETLFAALVENGAIHVTRLETERSSDGVVHVRRRTPLIIGKAMVGTISPLHLELAEE